MSLIQGLVSEFKRLPGVGEKTAQRFVYSLLKKSDREAMRLASQIREVVEKVHPCAICGSFTEFEECGICTNQNRDVSLICVVEEAHEVEAIERSSGYSGLYHVLGGRLSPLDGVGPQELNLASLFGRIKNSVPSLQEVVIATNSSVEGEATAVYLEALIKPLGPKVTRLARGIPVGGDLEYVDTSTIVEALAGRTEM
jgi:recombination protein RecR|tara:strand:- start:2129 stop:2722 length:594 start_codon:yes stop_codon:yes gene_type:complete